MGGGELNQPVAFPHTFNQRLAKAREEKAKAQRAALSWENVM